MKGTQQMSDFNWCHGPECHERKTQDRIRGVKGHKVLRTKKVKTSNGRSMYGNGGVGIWDYFCNHQCLMDYMAKHTQAIVSIAPRTECQETPITDPKKETVQSNWGNYSYTNTTFDKIGVDNA